MLLFLKFITDLWKTFISKRQHVIFACHLVPHYFKHVCEINVNKKLISWEICFLLYLHLILCHIHVLYGVLLILLFCTLQKWFRIFTLLTFCKNDAKAALYLNTYFEKKIAFVLHQTFRETLVDYFQHLICTPTSVYFLLCLGIHSLQAFDHHFHFIYDNGTKDPCGCQHFQLQSGIIAMAVNTRKLPKWNICKNEHLHF